MLPDPLHPAVVHFPIVLAVLLPPLAALALWAMGSGRVPRRAWLAVVALQALLLASTWLAVETGEPEEEIVEKIVAERYIEAHEEAAERFLWVVGLGLPLAAVGLLGGRLGGAARALTLGASLAALGAGASVGHSGGELVYRHGAATAYVERSAAADMASSRALPRARRDDDSDD